MPPLCSSPFFSECQIHFSFTKLIYYNEIFPAMSVLAHVTWPVRISALSYLTQCTHSSVL